MTVTVGPAGLWHLPEAAGALEPAAAVADALPEPPAADVDGLPAAPVELLELLHAAADSTVAAITAKSAGSRLAFIDSPGGSWRGRARQRTAVTVRSTPR
jgi:hypothetical protein